MSIFHNPIGLIEIAHFTLPQVLTWGNGEKDTAYKGLVRDKAKLVKNTSDQYSWFVFWIRSVIGESRRRKQGPDVEKIPKLIVDAFTGYLYPDDNIDHVRGVQVEAEFGPDNQEKTEIWIYGNKVKEEKNLNGNLQT